MRRLSRRHFFAASGAALGTLPIIRLAAQDASGPFRHGVASGDPLADGVVLWTRVTTAQSGGVDVSWTIARDAAMSRVVARGTTPTGAERDHTVKVIVSGLEPGTTYYYRFDALKGRSPVGRTRTLPQGSVARVRLGIASCANFPFGYFNAYRRMAERQDLDAVLHLGDYLYEYENGRYGDGTKLDRVTSPNKEMVALEDYRGRHAQYKGDPDLQELHRQHPFVVVWDDHEFTNNTWKDGAENHNPDKGEGDWYVRRDAAVKAYFEWMPIREGAGSRQATIYRTLSFGDLADLVMLDTRMVGRDREAAARDAIDVVEAPGRTLLGAAQEQWLAGELAESKRAGSVWQLLGQQVMFAPQTMPGKPTTNTDSWDGYRAARDRVFDTVESLKISNLVVLTGDVHSAWAYDIARRPFEAYDPTTGRGAVGVEIVGTSITSPSNVGAGPDGEKQLADIKAARPHLRYVDGRYRGYVVLDLTRERLQADYYTVPTIQDRVKEERFEKGLVSEAGKPHLIEAASPAGPTAGAPDPAP
jgi:alkaline phosphatase D